MRVSLHPGIIIYLYIVLLVRTIIVSSFNFENIVLHRVSNTFVYISQNVEKFYEVDIKYKHSWKVFNTLDGFSNFIKFTENANVL